MVQPYLDDPWVNPGDPVDPGSGGSPTGSPVTPQNVINDLQTDEGATRALAYGRHLVAGQLILHDYQAGPPASSTVLVALGMGEWDSVEKLWYAGEEIAAASYHFHPGTFSTGPTDPLQGVDPFFPTGLTYNKTAYVAVQIPEPFVSEDRPEKLRGLYKTLKVADYDANGNQIGYGYSSNPARVVADLIVVQGKRPKTRIHWASWVAFRNYCDELIPWNDGTTNRQIRRFECHIVFTGPTDLAAALSAAMGTGAAWWQDDGRQIRFLPPLDTAAVHAFNLSNIVDGSFSFYQRDIRERPNRIKAKFRNLDDKFLLETQVETKRDALQDKVGVVDPGDRAFGNMTVSQAQRVLERQMRLEADNAILCELRGQGDSLHVLPGDYVTVTHDVSGWNSVRCLVIDAVDDSPEDQADERAFILQRIDAPLYSDLDHTPIQKAIAADTITEERTYLYNDGIGREWPLATSMRTGCVSYWNCNDAAGGDVADAVGPNTLVDVGGCGTAAGRLGQAIDFIGSGQYKKCVSPVGLSPGNADFTVSAWVYLTSKANYSHIMMKYAGVSGRAEWLLQYAPSSDSYGPDAFHFAVNISGTYYRAIGPSGPTLNTWYFLCAWHDTAAGKYYLQVNNGTPSSVSTPAATVGAGELLFGFFEAGTYTATCRLDAAGYWARMLSA